LWEDSRTEWTDYILACSPEESTGYVGGYVWFKITSWRANESISYSLILNVNLHW